MKMHDECYEIKENHIIVHQGESQTDITEAEEECDYCIHTPGVCPCKGRMGVCCDWFKTDIPEKDD